MKSSRITLALLGLAVVVGALLLTRQSPRSIREIPDFVLPDLSGGVVRMREQRGRVVLLNLWATWCPPCVEEMPTLESLHRRMQGEDFVLLAVSQDEQTEVVGPWIEQRGFTFPVLLDPRGELGHGLGATGYPETFVIDRNGTIVHRHVGYRDWSEEPIVEAVHHLLRTGEWSLEKR